MECYSVINRLQAYDERLFSHKKNEILPFMTTWMDLESIMLSVASQTGKDKYLNMILLKHGIFKR